MRWCAVRLARLLAVAVMVLLVLTALPLAAARASSTWSSDHEFQFDIPDGWTIQLNPSDRYNEPDLKALAQTPDQTQEISVYHETLSSGQRTALQYLQDSFRTAASNRANFRVDDSPDYWDVENASSGAHGIYTYIDKDGIAQYVERVVAVRGTDVYVLNVLPTLVYARQHDTTLLDVVLSFQLLP